MSRSIFEPFCGRCDATITMQERYAYGQCCKACFDKAASDEAFLEPLRRYRANRKPATRENVIAAAMQLWKSDGPPVVAVLIEPERLSSGPKVFGEVQNISSFIAYVRLMNINGALRGDIVSWPNLPDGDDYWIS